MRLLLTIILIGASTNLLKAQEKPKLFKDSIDNAFDISHYMYNLHGLLPIISPITEPAVGYGAAAALVYFIPKKPSETKKFQMPDIATGFGGYTQNSTWFAGVAYMGFWNNDKVRYRGILGYGDIKLSYYGTGENPIKEPVDFNLNISIFLQQAITRIGSSNFFIGGKYIFTQTNVVAFEEINIPGVNPLDKELTSSGVEFITEFENYNNILSPSKGVRLHLSYDQNLELIGSDRNYGRLTFYSYTYLPVNEKWVPAFRVESQLATGEVPFYALPFVSLRGVPAIRYQGELTFVAETEHSLSLSPRWSLVGFAGLGTAFNNVEELVPGDLAWNAGGGFRYLIARMLGLKMGLDIARGPEDTAFYIVFGSSWMR
jgi:surface antigen Omp85-like protein